MAKRLTVFYSWQSDSPSKLNRTFIEKALREALAQLHSNAILENALRDTVVELDKDTQGVAGSPPIAETILKKIEDCAVFVADLSFVGESKKKLVSNSGRVRQFPNPNVLMEYGYALRCHSHAKIIGIMNVAYGKPDAESLPFDLRHLRWPITYNLTDLSQTENDDQFRKLVEILVKAIGLILGNYSFPIATVEKFSPQKSTTCAAVYFDKSEDLIYEGRHGRSAPKFTIPDGAKAYLRLCPKATMPLLETELEAKALSVKGNLAPMGKTSGYNNARNIFGSTVYEAPLDDKLYHFTQLFLSREIWGVDAECLNYHIADRDSGKVHFIDSRYIEDIYITILENYLTFAQKHLDLSFPLTLEAGLVGIKGYAISIDNSVIVGTAMRDEIEQHIKISENQPPHEILSPFFDKIWANCGIPRAAEKQKELAKRRG